ncbi:MAG: hypothetical protein IPJ13_13055 [Saprospiraceae bacterium]|nr:hypothetical protein [Saprospiraceae bacterium]
MTGVSGGYGWYISGLSGQNGHGLRPIAVHLDNGWNSKLSVTNIKTPFRYWISLYILM